jgi:hypothetical protein
MTANLAAHARVWVYQSNRPFSESETQQIDNQLVEFVKTWASHQNKLAAAGEVLHNRFVVLMVDEQLAGASGCSIDSSVRFLKQLEQQYQVNLFDRFVFSYLDGEEAQSVDSGTFADLYRQGKINDETLVFDPLVQNKAALDAQFIKPLGKSWHKRMV